MNRDSSPALMVVFCRWSNVLEDVLAGARLQVSEEDGPSFSEWVQGGAQWARSAGKPDELPTETREQLFLGVLLARFLLC